jgi:hypothetical protein
MRRARGSLLSLTLLAIFAMALGLPHHALAVIRLAQSNTVSLTNGLVGYWTFDGPVTNWATGKTKDLSGNGNDGSLGLMSTSSSPTPGKIGQAMTFNGSRNYITVSSTLNNSISTQVSVSAWIKANESSFAENTGIINEAYLGDDTVKFAIAGNTGGNPTGVSAGFYDGSWHRVEQSGSIQFAQWQHVVGTYDGAKLRIYINGALSATVDDTAGLPPGTEEWRIGRRWDLPDYFNGVIDDVRIYNRALSAQEIKQLYNLGQSKVAHSNTIISNGLVGYWTFDGQDIDWSTNTFKDIVGGYNATSSFHLSGARQNRPSADVQRHESICIERHIHLADNQQAHHSLSLGQDAGLCHCMQHILRRR